MSKIAWTQETWNPLAGCTKCSAGCANCYAVSHARRLGNNPHKPIRHAYAGLTESKAGRLDWTGQVRLLPTKLDRPLHWRKPRIIFVNSMSDLFHPDVPEEFIQRVFDVMNKTPRHTFQVLTKRSERLAKMAPALSWGPNIWMGVTVENAACLNRIDDLRQTGARVKFLSCEPLLSPLPGLDLSGIGWVIVGGEKATKFRPMDDAWVRDIRDLCVKASIPFFFKQRAKKLRGKPGLPLLDGRTWVEMPERLAGIHGGAPRGA